jgi:hypothetical protein
MGRPTKYTKEMPKKAEEYLAKGFSKEATAGYLGIHKDTLYEWVKKHKLFSDAIKRGEARGLQQIEQWVIAKMSGQDIKGFDPKKSDTTLLIFMLKTRFHKVYGDRIKVEDDTPFGLLMGAMKKVKEDD